MLGMRTRASTLILAATLLLPAAALGTETKAVPETKADIQMSFAPLVKRTADAVVNVYAERIVKQQSPFADDPFFSQFFGQRIPNRSEKQYSLGSGVIASADGYIVTNNHVVQGADDIKVALADGREYPSKVVLKDERLDLAVLKIAPTDPLQALPIGNSDTAEVGDLVLAIGNPFGVGQTVTSGIISALARNQVANSEYGVFIQTDAAINPGNSGGALMNIKGELIGINTAIFSKGGGSNGIGFAIPANLVRVFLAAAERGAPRFERPYIGASFEPVTSEVAQALGLHTARGALVLRVTPDGPAAEAGLKAGQVVTAVNGLAVEHPDSLGYRLATAGLDANVRLTLLDKGQERSATLHIQAAPEIPPRDARVVAGRNPLDGAAVANLSPRVAEEMMMPGEKEGVVITDVESGSIAQELGFLPKDIILSVNGMAAQSTKVLSAALKDRSNVWSIDIERDGQQMHQVFR